MTTQTTRHLKRLLLPVLLLAGLAQASEPKAVVKCTTADRQTWVSEARIRQKFDESQYVKVIFKVSRGNCYEFYAIAKDGSIVEAYYDPVRMELLRYSKVAPDGGFKGTAVTASEQSASAAVSKTQPVSAPAKAR